jgi:hypothetical protein
MKAEARILFSHRSAAEKYIKPKGFGKVITHTEIVI